MDKSSAIKKGYLNSDFIIFHLKDEEEKTYNFHYHDFNKIVIFISGDVSYCIEGRNYELSPFDIVLVQAGEIHRPVIHSSKVYERIIIYTSEGFLNAYKTDKYDLAECFKMAAAEGSNVIRLNSAKNSRIFQCVRQLENSYYENDYAEELNHQILFLEFLIQLNRAVIHQKLTYLSISSCNGKIQEIIYYINTHLNSDLSIDFIASHFYISRFYLMHAFKNESGYSINAYITMKRLLLARDLIQNGTNITESCYAAGFQNYSTFSRAFKKQFNKTPSEYIKTSL